MRFPPSLKFLPMGTLFFLVSGLLLHSAEKSPIIVDHTCTQIKNIPAPALEKARETLRIAYGHTSHGSQLISGLQKLGPWAESAGLPTASLLTWDPGEFDLRDRPFAGAKDLGNPNRTAWVGATRDYLQQHPDINVVMWSWCGQMSTASPEEIDAYLQNMTALEKEFPQVRFVYMTGHVDGSGTKGKHYKNAEKIRSYCRANGKVLYDFADIESWDPDGKTNYYPLNVTDNCDYQPVGGGTANWALDWQAKHPGQWYPCSSAHSQPLNANLKAFAAWWLFARLAGWPGN